MEHGVLFTEAIVPKPGSIKTTGKHWLFKAILDGCFIMEFTGFSERYKHCLYNVAGARVKKVTKAQWKTVARLVKKKKSRVGTKYLISLQDVRSLHGNDSRKRIYKAFKQSQKSKTKN